jgi:hypothetical protein
MRLAFIFIVCLFGVCLGDGLECELLPSRYSDKELKTMEFPADKRFSPKRPDIGECRCHRVVTCWEMDYCVFWLCPDEVKLSAIFSKKSLIIADSTIITHSSW